MADFTDDVNNYGDKVSSVRDIVLSHIKKISDLTCQELTGSWTERKPIKTSTGMAVTEIYHPDLREAYCNAVQFLLDLIEPEGKLEDPEFKTNIDNLIKSLDTTYDSYKDNKDDKLIRDPEKSNLWMRDKLIIYRKIFKEINNMFFTTNYFDRSSYYKESAAR